jgi:hypothetical protein
MKLLLATAILVTCSSAANAADALSRLDDEITSLTILGSCHMLPAPLLGPKENAQKNEKEVASIGDDAWRLLWTALDQHYRADHDKNGRKADRLLQERIEVDQEVARADVVQQGCRVLTPHALETWNAYRQSTRAPSQQ